MPREIESKVTSSTPPIVADLPKLLEICIDRLNDAIVITEAEPIEKPGPRIVWANRIFYERTGYSPEEIIGQSPRILQGPESDRATLDKIRVALQDWKSIRVETLNYRKDGTTYWSEFEIVPVANEAGWFTHWISVQRDVTQRKALEASVNRLAFYDPLTSLPNRRLMEDRLHQAMSASTRSGLHAALMVLDLDNFKPLNDTYGHSVGDLLLVEVASRLTNCVRGIDTIARLGGDEFVVEKIRVALEKPYHLRLTLENGLHSTVEHFCSASIGVSMFLDHQVAQRDLINRADSAM
jgi:diguanylate cyclase (GGDEF)-like protein/PAS domain S-box-containing protein